ncbi:MAG: SCO1664 family protein [Micrococcaceae bacterium]|nr:SCO1664 family protein [Micrococcaceae bacterium]
MQDSPVPPPDEQSPAHHEILADGEIELLGQLANSSNETFLVEITHDDEQCWAIYKPELGERPLMDFEHGLYRRERATYLLSETLGWHIVPTTVVRDDGPFGIGSLQLFIDHDPAEHFFTMLEDKPETHDQLRRLAVFDLLINNADRKAGHVLYDSDGRLWGIDHGLCFAAPLKLRTVIWDFADEEIDAELLDDLEPLMDEVPESIEEQLSWRETSALQDRVRQLLFARHYPDDPTGMRFPWPLV